MYYFYRSQNQSTNDVETYEDIDEFSVIKYNHVLAYHSN